MKQYAYDVDGCPIHSTDGAGWADQQLLLAHRYYNELVAARKAENAEIETWRVNNSPEYAVAYLRWMGAGEAIHAVYETIKQRRAIARSRVPATPDERERLALLKRDRSTQKRELARLRDDLKTNAAYVAFLSNLNDRYSGVPIPGKRKRGDSIWKRLRRDATVGGLHSWGYIAVEAALENEQFPTFRELACSPWRQLTIQTQMKKATQKRDGYRMTWDIAVGGADNRLRVLNVYTKPNGNKWAIVEFGIGRGKTKTNVQVKFWMHRDLPAGSHISCVHLLRQKVGQFYQWRINFVVGGEPPPADAAPSGMCALDYNWRVMDSGLRVATWHGEPVCPIRIPQGLKDWICWDAQSQVGTVFIPATQIARRRKCDELESIRDKNFNAAKLALRNHLSNIINLPDWLSEELEYLSQWRSQRRLFDLCQQWRSNRFTGDVQAFDALAAWVSQDRHLEGWASPQLTKWLAMRKNLYRNVAAILRRSYHTVYLEGGSKADLARRPDPDEEENKAVRQWRFVAASGELCRYVEEAATHAVRIDPAYTSKQCSQCNGITALEGQTIYTCEHCGAVWDCDENACRNLLAAGLAGESEGG